MSSYFALYGKLIEKFFKIYTNSYSRSMSSMPETQVRSILERLWKHILETNYVDWKEPWVRETPGQIFERVYQDVLKNLKAFDFWKQARSEVTIDIRLKNTDLLTSRLDFIWEKPDGTVEILDGKGTDKIDTNVDVEQLFFYALIYSLKHGKMPDKIGFLYYQYQLIKYVDMDKATIVAFKNKLVSVKKAIKEDKIFAPNVKLSKHCRWCGHKYTCEAFNNKKVANAEKKGNKNKIAALEDATEVTNFGM